MHFEKRLALFLAIFLLALFPVLLGSCNRPSTGNLHVLITGVDNTPLAGAKVVSNTQPGDQLKVTGLTQTDGTVTYNEIRAGEYEFYISRFDYEQKEFNVKVVAGRTTEITINLDRTPTAPTPTS